MKTVYASNIIVAFRMAGVPESALVYPACQLLDNVYVPVSAAWMRANHDAWVESLPKELKRTITINGVPGVVPVYIPEAFDCENHTDGAMTHGNVGNALTALRTKIHAGLGKGSINYTAIPGRHNLQREGRHVAGWRYGHNNKIYFFEHGDGREIDLLREEIQSVTSVRAI